MPEYGGLKTPKTPKGFTPQERLRTAKNLLRLRKQLKEEIPPKTLDDTLLLATWNLRDFGRKGSPRRINESLYYIAEILATFDVVALQEIRRDLEDFYELVEILGKRDYRALASDVTEGDSSRKERLVFVYDTRKATFLDIASKVVLPSKDLITVEKEERRGRKVITKSQFATAPFLAGLQAGWFKFMLCNVHIYFGSPSRMRRRIAEIGAITEFIKKRAHQEEERDYNYIVLGDFNIVHPDHETIVPIKEAKESGFEILDELKRPTSISGEKYYDQIIFKPKENELRLGDSKNNAGVFNCFKSVFRDDDFETYADYIKGPRRKFKNEEVKRKYYLTLWRTFQMSDHFPLWVELKIDFSKEYLAESMEILKREAKKKITKS